MTDPCRQPPSSDATPGVRARVLVVDDERALRESLAHFLGVAHVVETAGSAREALDRLRSGACFDVILSDVAMPGGSGADLHDAIAREFPACAPRVVFMTGGLTLRLRERIERLPNPCLAKPLDLDAVSALVTRAARLGSAPEPLRPPLRSTFAEP